MRRRLRSNKSTIFKLAMVGIVAMAGGFLLTSFLGSKSETQALSATEFQPGRIIDDSIFYNPNTMTAAEIDAFIDSHSPACDMWGTQIVYGNVTRAEYVKQLRAQGNSKYHDPPFVCVTEYYENPETHKTNFSTGGRKEAGMLSAGEIIYKAAHEYNINPQVLLVMLKKESYVWGDDWPHDFQYNTVMGYACPDGAPCDSKYFGFYNQVMMAAWQLNYYREHIYSYNYRPYATNNILYNPDRSCGSKAVYLENLATTSLYIYTPYVPNDAALANYPGTSWCGSYGNRNFYMYFREWFGGTLGSSGEYEISKRYRQLGEESGALGEPIMDAPNCNIGRGGACVQAYENGTIIYSPSNGAWENYGDIRSRLIATGGVDGALGYPITGINCVLRNGSCVQGYENGVIISSKETGTWESYGQMRAHYLAIGSIDGPLGFPTSSQGCNGEYCKQSFENGIIIKNGSNVFSSYGNIYRKYASDNNYERLGELTTPVNCNIGHEGACVQGFEKGVIISNPSTGTWENSGEIRRRYINNGSVDGIFGFPLSDSICKNNACYQAFEHKAMLKDINGNYTVTSNEIAKHYLNVSEHLGGAIANINCNIGHEDACVQGFEKGVIISNPSTGTWENYGAIRSQYIKDGSVDGSLGFPTSGITCTENACSQEFENGKLAN